MLCGLAKKKLKNKPKKISKKNFKNKPKKKLKVVMNLHQMSSRQNMNWLKCVEQLTNLKE